MSWETFFGVLSIIVGIACGIITLVCIIQNNRSGDYINPFIALFIAICMAALGYMYGLLALVVYFGAKIFMNILWCVADIIDFIYVAYFSKKYNTYRKRKTHF